MAGVSSVHKGLQVHLIVPDCYFNHYAVTPFQKRILHLVDFGRPTVFSFHEPVLVHCPAEAFPCSLTVKSALLPTLTCKPSISSTDCLLWGGFYITSKVVSPCSEYPAQQQRTTSFWGKLALSPLVRTDVCAFWWTPIQDLLYSLPSTFLVFWHLPLEPPVPLQGRFAKVQW